MCTINDIAHGRIEDRLPPLIKDIVREYPGMFGRESRTRVSSVDA
jgi:hypothetical protein